MSEAVRGYRPDYAVAPGLVLEEMLETAEFSQAEFARRCGRSAKLINEIISGHAPIEPETAIQFERVLGMDAEIWLNIEARYRLFETHAAEDEELNLATEWYNSLPVAELVKLGVLDRPTDILDGVKQLLSFFGVGSVDAWQQRYNSLAIAYRHSPKFKSSNEAVATWLRLGEIEAETQKCAEFNKKKFIEALDEIRSLTVKSVEEFVPEMGALCNGAGVAFVIIPPLPKTALSGIARWLTPRKALIQQSMRHLSNDHFWFTFFHEAAHLILHSKKDVFIEEAGGDGSVLEEEANIWARNVLVPQKAWAEILLSRPVSKNDVGEYAKQLNIAPGILVGMLQHERIIPWKSLNALKERYQWVGEE